MMKQEYQEIMNDIEALQSDCTPHSLNTVANKICHSKPSSFLYNLNHDSQIAPGTFGMELMSRDDAISNLEQDFDNNSDISEENNQSFRRDIDHKKNDHKARFYLFRPAADEYDPITFSNLMLFLLYAATRAKEQYYDCNFPVLNNYLDDMSD